MNETMKSEGKKFIRATLTETDNVCCMKINNRDTNNGRLIVLQGADTTPVVLVLLCWVSVAFVLC